jgi:hypothetical protein
MAMAPCAAPASGRQHPHCHLLAVEATLTGRVLIVTI